MIQEPCNHEVQCKAKRLGLWLTDSIPNLCTHTCLFAPASNAARARMRFMSSPCPAFDHKMISSDLQTVKLIDFGVSRFAVAHQGRPAWQQVAQVSTEHARTIAHILSAAA